ncbi:MAG: hypothetical protein JSW11_20245, partial [Candidatus Heimdallarchaeota archaeon]
MFAKNNSYLKLVMIMLMMVFPIFLCYLMSNYGVSQRIDRNNTSMNTNNLESNHCIQAKVTKIQDSPIIITNDGGFTVAGFSGIGTVLEPYILKDKIINAAGLTGINITNTTAHFRIEDVLING